MKSKLWCFLLSVLLFVSITTAVQAETRSDGFVDVIVNWAIGFMPTNLEAELRPIQGNIVSAAKRTLASEEMYYCIENRSGKGPEAMARQFQLVENGLRSGDSHSSLAVALGEIAGITTAMSLPHRTNRTEYLSPARPAFEKGLDSVARYLLVTNTNQPKVANASDYAIRQARQANALLPQLGSENPQTLAAQSAVLNMAVRGVVNCWSSLTAESAQAATTTEPVRDEPVVGRYIGNRRSLKFHLPTCRYQPAPQNQVPLNSREEAINSGFDPCKVCKP